MGKTVEQMIGNSEDSLVSLGTNVFAITPDDDTEVSPRPKHVRIDQAGTVAWRSVDGAADITQTYAAGEYLQGIPLFIRADGTTAVMHGSI